MGFKIQKVFHLLLALSSFNLKYTFSNVVYFYSDTFYRDILLKAEDQHECKNLSEDITSRIISIMTDGCTVFYKSLDCSTTPVRVTTSDDDYQILTIGPGEAQKLREYKLHREVRSFRRCSRSVKRTRVEIPFIGNRGTKYVPDQLTLSHGECTPIRNRYLLVNSLETDGCLIAYSSKSCNSPGVMINPSGGNRIKENLSSYYFIYGIGSFRVCNESRRFGQIKFFDESSKGLINVGVPHEECSPLPNAVINKTFHAWSSECVMLFANGNCHFDVKFPQDFNLNLEKGETRSLMSLQNVVSSYQLCTPMMGGEKAEIIFGMVNLVKKFSQGIRTFSPAEKVCGCEEFGQDENPDIMLSNSVCVELYHEAGCAHWGRTIPGGENQISLNLGKDYFTGEVFPPFRSFKLCQAFPSCFNVTVTARRVKVLGNFSEEFINGTIEIVEIGPKEVFLNNGNVTLVQEYLVKKWITEEVKVERVKSVTDQDSLEISLETIGSLPVWLENLEASFNAAYQSYDDSKADMIQLKEGKEFKVTQKIEISPCTIYEASSFVRVANLPMDFEIFVDVKGQSVEGWKADKNWVKNNLPGDLEYVEDKDDFTVIGKGRGKILAIYGLNSVFKGEGKPIPGCKFNSI